MNLHVTCQGGRAPFTQLKNSIAKIISLKFYAKKSNFKSLEFLRDFHQEKILFLQTSGRLDNALDGVWLRDPELSNSELQRRNIGNSGHILSVKFLNRTERLFSVNTANAVSGRISALLWCNHSGDIDL